MAQKVFVQLVDDLDGSSYDDISTVQFGLDGAEYEIDLGAVNAGHLRDVFADYVSAARRTGGRLKRGTRSADQSSESGESASIRSWAIENGYELSSRGRIAAHVIDAYREAQAPKKQTRVKAAAKSSAKRGVATKKS